MARTAVVSIPSGGNRYLSLPGLDGHRADTPFHASFGFVGDIDMRAKVALPMGTDAAFGGHSFGGTNGPRGFYISAANTLFVAYREASGSNRFIAGPTVSFGPFTVHELRATRTALDGAIRFYEFVGAAWTQIGNTAGSPASDMQAPTNAPLLVGGSLSLGVQFPFEGRIYSYEHRNGINGTIVARFDANDFQVGDSDGATAVDVVGRTWTIRGAQSVVMAEPTVQAVSPGTKVLVKSVLLTAAAPAVVTFNSGQSNKPISGPMALPAGVPVRYAPKSGVCETGYGEDFVILTDGAAVSGVVDYDVIR